ncbi:type II toxin-antitoxin system ParD family antitoxin [Ectothiorhodospira haloalkaliphila]|uniref:type II toxin-antitoxin system ParD family antitoxin n=1 Tax=Ectothiorhodospira haloalkaliphila TaxID=421628 RepID=UPI001EE89E89|nr:type II toxin-antitoxin system ParD family antitoxin [Ectothiorhodospira haloalkaliphila]MCG5526334.1 type II toxin-antitoxin system ParD family antitoxin [Ectothiorhodospira haloalkaliphila]
MPTRNIVLTDQQALFVEQMVATGRYQNASEVLREGLRLLQQREHERAIRLQSWQAAPVVNTTDVRLSDMPTDQVSLMIIGPV